MDCSLTSMHFDSPQFGIQKSNLYQTIDLWSRDMFNFDFSEKVLGVVSPPQFEDDFSKKCDLCYILLTDQILNKLWRHKFWN